MVMRGGRLHFVDNVKGILIILVVLGHYRPQVPQWSTLATCVHELVFLFHMPLFVFVSGLFAKSLSKGGRLRAERILSVVALGFAYQLVLIAVERPGVPFAQAALNLSWASWYLVSLGAWYAFVPALEALRPRAGVGIALALSLAAGVPGGVGDFLALDRTLVFAPCFALGYYCPLDGLAAARRSPWARAIVVAAAAFVVAWFALGLAGSNPFFEFKQVMHADAYRDGVLLGMLQRLAGFAGAGVVSAGLLFAVPDARGPLATLGERTLPVYVLHRVVRPFLKAAGAFSTPPFQDPVLAVASAAALSVAVAFACAWRPVARAFDAALRASWRPLVRG